MPPKFDATSGLPQEKAARFRLYKIVDKKTNYIENAEGHAFPAPADDIMYVGGFSKTVYLNKAELSDQVRLLDGFFWIRFRKKNGQVREMWAQKMHSKILANITMRDLELPNTKQRQCLIDNVLDFITNDTHYIVGKAPNLKKKKKKTKRPLSPSRVQASDSGRARKR